jgi:hypothetical protein
LRFHWKIHESCGSDDPIDGRKDDEGSYMKPANPRILTINGGSSSIKFALFEAGDPLRRIIEGGIERIGLPEASFWVKALNPADGGSRWTQ